MSKHLTKSEIKTYVGQWDAVNKREKELLQKTPFSTKLLQFLSLVASAHLFGVYAKKAKESRVTYERWQIIRGKVKGA